MRNGLVFAWGMPDGAGLAWIVLHVGLGLFTLALFLLLVTRWGNVKPLRKCIILSLWAHVLLAIYAATLSVLPAPAKRPVDALVKLSDVDGAPEGTGQAEEPAAQPWDKLATSVPEIAIPEPPLAAKSPEPPPEKVEPPAEPPKLAAPPPPEMSFDEPISRAPKSAEPFDMPALTELPPRASMLPQLEPLPDEPAASKTASAPHQAPAAMQLRTSENRLGEAQRRGGSTETEGAVRSALDWLAKHQSPDGRWDASAHGAGRETFTLNQDRGGAGANADTGITGLALLAMLGAGQTHHTGDHTETVAKGLNFLVQTQRADGALGGTAEPFAFMYCHGMATLAIGEAYAMTGDERLRDPLRRAISYTLASQNPSTGGWRYRPHETGDMSQLGWQLMALRSAQFSGIEIPSSAKDGMIRFVSSVGSGRHGGLGSYRPGEQISRSMTAEALACRQFLGMTRENPASDEAGDYLLGELPSANAPNFYYWYYGTLGMYQLQGSHWERWNTALQSALVQHQRRDGDSSGSWDPDPLWGGYGGRVYSTALGALCLEVYYRYLPLYGETTAQRSKPAAR